jgi:hypothetical protein
MVVKRYPLQTLLFDGLALAIGISLQSGAGAAIPYVFGPPVVHFVHGNIGKGFASFGMRVAPMLLILNADACLKSSSTTPPEQEDYGDDGDCLGPAMLAVLGFLALPAATAIDAAVLAKKKVRVEPASTWSVAPHYQHRRGEAGVALSTRF